MHGQWDLIGGEHLGDGLARLFAGFTGMDLGADNVARISVDHYVRIKVGVLGWPANFVLAQVNTSPCWCATNSGICLAG